MRQCPQSRSLPAAVAQQGFTLLEMLLAFSLMSLLFLALFASFNTIGRGWDVADRKILQSADIRLVSEFLRNQLSQMMVVQVQSKRGPLYAFEGEDYYVRYAAPLQPLQQQGGVYLIELAANIDADGRKLELRYAPYRPEMDWEQALDGVEPVLLYAGLRSVRFEYLAADTVNDQPRWENEWVGKPVYPLLLKVMLEGKDQAVWPELVVDLPQVDEYVGAN